MTASDPVAAVRDTSVVTEKQQFVQWKDVSTAARSPAAKAGRRLSTIDLGNLNRLFPGDVTDEKQITAAELENATDKPMLVE